MDTSSQENRPVLTVTKTNDLVRHVRYNLNKNEKRVLLLLLSKIPFDKRKGGELLTQNDIFEIRSTELTEVMGVFKKNAYRDLVRGIEGLQDQVFYKRTDQKGFSKERSHWLHKVYLDDVGKAGCRFHEDLIPYISNMREQFTQYPLKEIAKMKTETIRMYEIVLSLINIKDTYEIGLTDFKETFCLENKYRRWEALKRRILDPVKREINEYTDLNFDYTVKKDGRKVNGLIFKFKRKIIKGNKYSKKKTEQTVRALADSLKQKLESESPDTKNQADPSLDVVQ